MRPPLWAKLHSDGATAGWLGLVEHSADVAAVFLALLAQPTLAMRAGRAAGGRALCAVTTARLGVLAFLHDIGKANRGFRARWDPGAPRVGHIAPIAWLLGGTAPPALTKHLDEVLGLERLDAWFAEDGWGLFDAVFAHHGRPWNRDSGDAYTAAPHWIADETEDPIAGLAPMRAALDRWFADAFADAPTLPSAPAFQHFFAGLLMLADWLASDREFFPFDTPAGQDRMGFAQRQAQLVLAAVGLAAEVGRIFAPPAFDAVFGFAPQGAQVAIASPEARLLVLESETGSGKTEAALWRFAALHATGAVDGIYFALPTRVAATQMHGRLRRFRDGFFGSGGPGVVRAVPGQVSFDDAEGRPLPGFEFEWSDDPSDGAARTRWAAEHPKRFFAAQLAVGTIDQALLAALQVRHAQMRGAALSRHLLVVDEVHASDTYMRGVLRALLDAHLGVGGHALLLSATLGAGARAVLTRTATPTQAEAERSAYPCIAWAQDGALHAHPIAATGRQKSVAMRAEPWLDDPTAIATCALQAAEAGARVLVIRNTVGGAVAVQQALEVLAGAGHLALFRVGDVPTLHHGRFALADRVLLDRAVETRLGKPGVGPCVVVGSQTLEQSLDLDADLLLTDLCPVDVLLQRIGRLHRHPCRVRPRGFADPVCVVATPADRDLTPLTRRGRHGLGAYVYEDLRVIEATRRQIEADPMWRIPLMNRQLVERATHPDALLTLRRELGAHDRSWIRHIDGVEGGNRAEDQHAAYAVLRTDEPFENFRISNERLVTRLGLSDRHVRLDPPLTGPFGTAIDAISVPGWMCSQAPPDLDCVPPSGDGPSFQFGATTFIYDRLGLRSGKAAA